jgi:hypothetical protein
VNSFETSGPELDPSMDENKHLRSMILEWNNLGSHLYPSVVINNITFRGQLNPYNVFEAICAGYKDTPHECTNFLLEEGMDPKLNQEMFDIQQAKINGVKQTTFFGILALLVVVNIILVLAYRKCLQKEIQDDMKIQVSSAVSQYVALSQIKELQDPSRSTSVLDDSVYN